eukprot:TRINITY_DN3153_c0_g1_i3.p1 TRINITY_DN3153_c0_g1~~TRINITY_DN3153_c0_g1_i3.p1  ORF type:complete len:445 (+),score=157.60 TRINITY_DN3153_c0_g1_i3:64-1398(+)
MATSGPVRIDGADGGGQVLRNSFVVAALLQRPVQVVNIRGARNPPGLKAQHLTGIKACADVNGAALTGGVIGSEDVVFVPGTRVAGGGEVVADAQTAGSCTLLLQTLLPMMLYAEAPQGYTRVVVRGGTDVAFSPPLDYFTHALLPTLARFGVQAQVVHHRRGVFPKGQGEVVVDVEQLAAPLAAVDFTDPGSLARLYAHVFVTPVNQMSEKDAAFLKRACRDALTELRSAYEGTAEAEVEVVVHGEAEDAAGHGAGVVLVAETTTGMRLTASALKDVKRKTPFGEIVSAAAAQLAAVLEQKVAVDEETQDQVLLFAALAQGTSRFLTVPPSDHTKSAMEVLTALVGTEFHVEPLDGGARCIISCTGCTLPPAAALAQEVLPAQARPPVQKTAPVQPQQPPRPGGRGRGGEERRQDADGQWYTRREFEEYYRGVGEWNRAPRRR